VDAAANEIILGAYSAAHAPQDWAAVLDRLTERYGANGIILWEWQGSGDTRQLKAPFFSSHYQRDILEDYLQRHQRREFTDQTNFEQKSLQFGRLAPDAIDLVNERDLYPNEAEYLEAPHVKELLSYGIRHRYGALLDRDNPFHARFSLQTSESRGTLSPEELAELKTLLPHLAKALDLTDALNERRNKSTAFLNALDHLNLGVCVLDPQARVIEKNGEFDRQIDELGAFWLSPDGKLVLNEQVDRTKFYELLEDFRNHGAFGARPRKEAVVVNMQDKAGALCLELLPPTDFMESGRNDSRFAVLISRDTTRPIQIDLHTAGRAFKLTSAETQVLDLVCRGLTNPAIAIERDRSVETINAQVKTSSGKPARRTGHSWSA
jgi:DNA-binding CsgD family transcriptional regulator